VLVTKWFTLNKRVKPRIDAQFTPKFGLQVRGYVVIPPQAFRVDRFWCLTYRNSRFHSMPRAPL
jgi:hypothetical protein